MFSDIVSVAVLALLGRLTYKYVIRFLRMTIV